MSFTTAWDETKPAGSRNLNLGDDDIREFKQQVRERVAIDHHYPSADDGNTGYHEKATLIGQGSDPSQVSSALILYAKTVGSYRELFSRHENASLQQLTLNGKLWIQALTMAGLAQGDVLYFDGTNITNLAAGTSGQFLKTQGAAANPAWANLSGSYIGGQFKNLAVASTGNGTISLSADEVLVDDGSGNVQRFTSVSLTCDMSVSGAGGLSTGAEAANVIYYVWLVAKSDGTKALIFDVSSSSPTLPSGYTYRALLSCVGNNNSSNFIAFKQVGKKYYFTAWASMASGIPGVGSWTSIDMTPADMSAHPGFVPSALSTFCFGSMDVGPGCDFAMTNDSSVSTNLSTATPNRYTFTNANGAQHDVFPWDFSLLTTETLYWLNDTASSTIYLHGFELNKL